MIAREYTDNLFFISLIVTLYNGMIFVSSIIFGRYGDILGRKRIVTIGFLFSAMIFFSHNLINNLSSLMMLRALAGIGAGMIPGPMAALAWGSSIGAFTAIGSLGFATGNFLAGMLHKNFFIFSTASLFCLIGFALTFFIKEKITKISVPLFPAKIIIKNLAVYLPFLIRHSAAQAIWAIFPIYLTRLGANKFCIGIIYAVNPLLQFLFMLFLGRYQNTKLIAVGLIATSITFFGYAGSPNWHIILLLQVILAFSWANLYLGSVKYLLENNLEQATAIGILSSVIGLAGILGPFIGGIISFLGMRSILFFSGILAFVAFITSKVLSRQAR